MIVNTEIGCKLYGAKLVSTNEKLKEFKSVRSKPRYSRNFWRTKADDKFDYITDLGNIPNGRVKALLLEFKRTGIKDFYVFFNGDNLHISKPNQFEYVFYNAK